MSQLGCEAINQGYNCFFYSGELPNYQFKYWMSLQFAGANNIDTIQLPSGEVTYSVKKDVSAKISDLCRGRFYLYDNSIVRRKEEMPKLLDIVVNMICRNNVKLICIDNLMTAMGGVSYNELYTKQSEFVDELHEIARKYNVCIILVAHPRKMNGNNFDNDEISGSSNITNLVDVIMSYSRVERGSKKKDSDGREIIVDWDNELIVTKNRTNGRLISAKKPVKLLYSPVSKRLIEKGGDTNKTYNWINSTNVSTATEDNEEPPF
jgi:twinkle protein